MSRIVFLIFALTLTITSTNAQDAKTVAKCDRNKNGVIDEWEIENLAKNLADPMLAQYDKNCDGKLDTSEFNARNDDISTVLVAKREEVRALYEAQRKPMPVGQLQRDLRLAKPSTFEPPFLLRDAYSPYSIVAGPPARDRAEGMQFSYTRDIRSSNDIVSASGAIIGQKPLALEAGADNPWTSLGVSRVLVAPAFEFDRKTNDKDPKKTADYLAARLFSEFEVEVPHALFRTHYFRYAAHLKSDWRGDSKIVGGYAEWQPTSLPLAIGAARPILPHVPHVQVRWQPMLRAEAEKVLNAGLLPNVITGDEYYRVGPIVQANMWFPDTLLDRLSVEFQYRYLWSLTSSDKNVEYFQGSVAYNLDEAGNYAIGLIYRDGLLPGNYTPVRDWKAALTIKH
jgi:hypothetical protein